MNKKLISINRWRVFFKNVAFFPTTLICSYYFIAFLPKKIVQLSIVWVSIARVEQSSLSFVLGREICQRRNVKFVMSKCQNLFHLQFSIQEGNLWNLVRFCTCVLFEKKITFPNLLLVASSFENAKKSILQ